MGGAHARFLDFRAFTGVLNSFGLPATQPLMCKTNGYQTMNVYIVYRMLALVLGQTRQRLTWTEGDASITYRNQTCPPQSSLATPANPHKQGP